MRDNDFVRGFRGRSSENSLALVFFWGVGLWVTGFDSLKIRVKRTFYDLNGLYFFFARSDVKVTKRVDGTLRDTYLKSGVES